MCGTGGRGIVTSMHDAARQLDLRMLRAATLDGDGAVVPADFLTIGTLTWPVQHAHRVLHAWRDWTAAAAGATSSVRLVRPPRGRPTVAVDVTWTGDAALLEPLRRLAPELDTIRPGAPAALRPAVNHVPPGMAPLTAHRRLCGLPSAAVDAFAAGAGPEARAELLSAELHHLGGVYVLAAIGAAAGSDGAERVRIGLAALERRMAPWTAA